VAGSQRYQSSLPEMPLQRYLARNGRLFWPGDIAAGDIVGLINLASHYSRHATISFAHFYHYGDVVAYLDYLPGVYHHSEASGVSRRLHFNRRYCQSGVLP